MAACSIRYCKIFLIEGSSSRFICSFWTSNGDRFETQTTILPNAYIRPLLGRVRSSFGFELPRIIDIGGEEDLKRRTILNLSVEVAGGSQG